MNVGFIGGKFLPLHLGHVYAITYASNMVDKLYVVLSHSEKRDRELSERDGISYISPDKRLSWLGKLASNMDNVFILDIEDEYGINDYCWDDGASRIKEAIEEPINLVFSSEESYTETFNILYPDAEHIIIDNERNNIKISATDIRKDLYGNWYNIPKYVRKDFVKKVAVIGTESCGKSTLVRNLAKIFDTNFVSEYGRDMCEEYSNFLTEEMFDEIIYKQKVNEIDEIKTSNRVMFIDSEAVVTQYYLGLYFNNSIKELYNQVAINQNYDMYLFLEPDVEWISDGLRNQSGECVRKTNNHHLKQMFNQLGIDYKIVKGSYIKRFNDSIELVNKLF
jgi:HTH-type transcriptional repressor of NAD biosynthesis genes